MPQIKLRDVPTETFTFILRMQGELKVEKKTSQYSLEKTIYKLLKELQEIKEKRLASSK